MSQGKDDKFGKCSARVDEESENQSDNAQSVDLSYDENERE